MATFFTIDRTAPRYRAYATYRQLTSPVLVAVIVLGLVVASATACAISFQWLPPTSLLLAAGLIGGGVGTLGLLLFFFATTYLDGSTKLSAQPSLTSHASFEVLGLLHRAGGTTHFGAPAAAVLQALTQTAAGAHWLERLGLAGDALVEQFSGETPEGLPENILAAAAAAAHHTGEQYIAVEHLLYAFVLQPTASSWLRSHDLQEADALFATWWLRAWRQTDRAQVQWWQAEKIKSATGLGLNFAAGFTPLSDRFSRIPVGNLWDMVNEGREELVEQLILTLARVRQSNVLLVGQPGVGRLGVIQELARRIRAQQAHPQLRAKNALGNEVVLQRRGKSFRQLAVLRFGGNER